MPCAVAPLPPALGNHGWAFGCYSVFCHFQNSIKKELHSAYLGFCPSSLGATVRDSLCCPIPSSLFFFIVAKYGYTPVCLYLLMDIWVVSNLGLFWAALLWRFAYKPCLDRCFHFSWVSILKRNSHVAGLFNWIRNCQTVFQSGCTVFIFPPVIFLFKRVKMSTTMLRMV